MPAPETRDKSEDYPYFTFGILMLLIGVRFFVDEPAMSREKLLTALCLIVGVVVLATAPKYMWRFTSLCTSVMVFGAFSMLYGILVFATGESGGLASRHVPHTSGLYAIVFGAIIAMIGFVLKGVYSLFKP